MFLAFQGLEKEEGEEDLKQQLAQALQEVTYVCCCPEIIVGESGGSQASCAHWLPLHTPLQHLQPVDGAGGSSSQHQV